MEPAALPRLFNLVLPIDLRHAIGPKLIRCWELAPHLVDEHQTGVDICKAAAAAQHASVVDDWREKGNGAPLLFGRCFEKALAAYFAGEDSAAAPFKEWGTSQGAQLEYSTAGYQNTSVCLPAQSDNLT
jgi:hypothetical protein